MRDTLSPPIVDVRPQLTPDPAKPSLRGPIVAVVPIQAHDCRFPMCQVATSMFGWSNIIANVFGPYGFRFSYPDNPINAEIEIRQIIPGLVFTDVNLYPVSALIGLFVPSLKDFKWEQLAPQYHEVITQASEVLVMAPPPFREENLVDEMRELLALCDSDDAPWKGKPWLIYDYHAVSSVGRNSQTFEDYLRTGQNPPI